MEKVLEDISFRAPELAGETIVLLSGQQNDIWLDGGIVLFHQQPEILKRIQRKIQVWRLQRLKPDQQMGQHRRRINGVDIYQGRIEGIVVNAYLGILSLIHI